MGWVWVLRRHRCGRKGAQLVLAGQGGNEAGVGGGVFRIAFDLAFHVGVDLEQGRKIRVVLAQQVIHQPFADQHDLECEGHRLGFELDGAAQADQLGQGFDGHRAGSQAALEAFPGVGLGQYLERIENEKAAIGPVQRAGAD